MAENFNNNYSRYYDLLYKDKDYKAEAEYISRLIRLLRQNAENIIELGCGTGNHAALLCKDGFNVTGIERSPEMVNLAKAKSIDGFTPIVGDIENYTLPGKFDAAISLFHVISYLTLNESLINCFRSTCQHLNNNGIFIFDVWYSPAVYYQQPKIKIKRMEDDIITITRLAEPVIRYNENVVDVNYEILIRNKSTSETEAYKETHPMRHFSMPEIKFLANQSGFEVIRTEEFFSGNEPGIDTWGIGFVLSKKKE
ncbi:MAG: class I SAM-dependent methyltransferase [Ginsengibacter sp.]